MCHGRLVIAPTAQLGENKSYNNHSSEKSECVHFVMLLLFEILKGSTKQILPACPMARRPPTSKRINERKRLRQPIFGGKKARRRSADGRANRRPLLRSERTRAARDL